LFESPRRPKKRPHYDLLNCCWLKIFANIETNRKRKPRQIYEGNYRQDCLDGADVGHKLALWTVSAD